MCEPPADAPSQIAGIAIGANAEDLRDRLDLARVAPLWDKPWLVRANLKPTKGFAAGYVILGGCATQNRVERVRLQYKDGSKALFDKLVRQLTDLYWLPLGIQGWLIPAHLEDTDVICMREAKGEISFGQIRRKDTGQTLSWRDATESEL